MPASLSPKVIIIMGVSGAGKTTIGQLLSTELGCPFYDGDDFHPQTNIDKMRQGIPLTDQDRDAWLTALQALIRRLIDVQQLAVIACSALKQSYRDRLRDNHSREMVFVYLKGDRNLIQQRLLARTGHFMKADLLKSQFDALEEPTGVLTVDVHQDPNVIVEQIKQHLRSLS
jgi:gluconokinase